jgi:hypothetical protein
MHQAKRFANQYNISGCCFRNRAKSRKVLAVERKAFADSRKACRFEPRMHLFSLYWKNGALLCGASPEPALKPALSHNEKTNNNSLLTAKAFQHGARGQNC